MSKADLFLFGTITSESGNQYAMNMRTLHSSGVTHFVNHINSVGGSVVGGYSIVSTFQYLKEQGCVIETINAGVAYSMAGVILSCGTKGKRKGRDYSGSMIHDPHFKDAVDMDESSKKQISDAREAMATILASCSGQSKDVISKLMSEETFMTPKEAERMGLIDEVIPTNIEIKAVTTEEKLVACGKLYFEIKKDKKMINEILNLSADATDEMVSKTIVALKNKAEKADTLATENELLANKIKTLEAENKTAKLAEAKIKAEALVAKAKSDGIISEEGVSIWMEDAIENFDKTEAKLKSIKVPSINAQLKENSDDKGSFELAAKYKAIIDNNRFDELEAMSKEQKDVMVAAFEKVYPVNYKITEKQ